MAVEFTPRFEEAPPPDPRLLTVIHMSGAIGYFRR